MERGTGGSHSEGMTPLEVGMCKKELETVLETREAPEKSAHLQLIHASSHIPKKARTREAMSVHSCPSAPPDAEIVEKSRWMIALSELFVVTETFSGIRLRVQLAVCTPLGLGQRSGPPAWNAEEQSTHSQAVPNISCAGLPRRLPDG